MGLNLVGMCGDSSDAYYAYKFYRTPDKFRWNKLDKMKITDGWVAFLSEIWDALRAATEADLTLAQAIVDSAGVIVQSADLTTCYDERGT